MQKYFSRLLLTYALFAVAPLGAQVPQRLSDLNPLQGSAAPRNLTSFNGKLYFSADNGTSGRELWSYDDSTNQLALVADIAPGSTQGVSGFAYFTSNASFAVLNGKMYLPGLLHPPGFSISLLSYDGSTPPSPAPGIPDSVFLGHSDFITFGNRIFFAAGTNATGIELYAYDGLSAPTVYDIGPDKGSSPHDFTVFNGKLYFAATGDFAKYGEELYVYDPATDQCSLVADLNVNSPSSACGAFTVAGNKMYFRALTHDFGTELWQYDGTAVTRLTDMAPGSNYGVGGTAYYKGSIIFAGSTDSKNYFPYKYNLSSGQIDRVSIDSTIAGFVWAQEYKGDLYFGCTKGLSTPLNYELYKYDGSNLSMMPEIWPGQKSSNPANFLVHDGNLYFTASDSAHGTELYRLADPTGMVNTRFDGELKLFPNPATTHATLELTLKSPQHISVSLADMAGRIVFTSGIRAFESGKNKIIIPLQSLPSGSYSYQLMNGSGRRLATGIVVKE